MENVTYWYKKKNGQGWPWPYFEMERAKGIESESAGISPSDAEMQRLDAGGKEMPQSSHCQCVAAGNDVEVLTDADASRTEWIVSPAIKNTQGPHKTRTSPSGNSPIGFPLESGSILDHDLAELIAVWSRLPATIRIGISAMVKTFVGEGGAVK